MLKAMQTVTVTPRRMLRLGVDLSPDKRNFMIPCDSVRSTQQNAPAVLSPADLVLSPQAFVVSGGPASPRPLAYRPWTSLMVPSSLDPRYSGARQPLRKATSKRQSRPLSAMLCPRQLLLWRTSGKSTRSGVLWVHLDTQ